MAVARGYDIFAEGEPEQTVLAGIIGQSRFHDLHPPSERRVSPSVCLDNGCSERLTVGEIRMS